MHASITLNHLCRRKVLECASPLATWKSWVIESTRGLAHSKTLTRRSSAGSVSGWPRATLIEHDPDGWYCYTAIHFVGDTVLLGYCAGDSKVGGLNRLRIRRASLEWLRQP